MPMIHTSTCRLLPAVLAPGVLLLLAGAATADPAVSPTPVHHAHHVHHHRRSAAASHMPVPAQQAADRATASTQPAPVPNENVSDVPPGQAPETQVTPSLLQLHYPHVGDGYVEGSSPSAIDDRNTAKAPGVEMQMPLK